MDPNIAKALEAIKEKSNDPEALSTLLRQLNGLNPELTSCQKIAPCRAQPDDESMLLALAATAQSDLDFPVDAHVIGEPVTVTRIQYPELPRVGLLATCKRGDVTYELSLADVVFPPSSVGASLVAQYREWLGFATSGFPEPKAARPHKIEMDELEVGRPVELVVLACKSNALRCRRRRSGRTRGIRTSRETCQRCESTQRRLGSCP